MFKKSKLHVTSLVVLIPLIMIGCSKVSSNSEEDTDVTYNSTKEIENHIPYINHVVDNDTIDKRYENLNKEELTYDTLKKSNEDNNETITQVYKADSISNDNYEDILLGFTYFSEDNASDFTYDEAIDLVKKVLPDDIEQVDKVLDNEVNKEYIYYKSSKGNFRVGLCYGYRFNEDNVEEVDKNLIVGIDYSKEIK